MPRFTVTIQESVVKVDIENAVGFDEPLLTVLEVFHLAMELLEAYRQLVVGE